jgi:hypothetical protein
VLPIFCIVAFFCFGIRDDPCFEHERMINALSVNLAEIKITLVARRSTPGGRRALRDHRSLRSRLAKAAGLHRNTITNIEVGCYGCARKNPMTPRGRFDLASTVEVMGASQGDVLKLLAEVQVE